MGEVYDFTQGRRNQGNKDRRSRSDRRPFGQDQVQRRRHLVDQIGKRMKERPKIRNPKDRLKIAENLGYILDQVKTKHGVRIADVLEDAGQGGPGKSTKRLPRFTLKPNLSREEKDLRDPKSLHATIAAYRGITEVAAKQSGQDVDALLIDLVRGSSYDPDAPDGPGGEVPEWAFALSDMLRTMVASVTRNSKLEWYFSKIEEHSLWLKTNEDSKDSTNLVFETDVDSCYDRIDNVIDTLSRGGAGVFSESDKYSSFNLFPFVWVGDIACEPIDVEISVSRDLPHEITNSKDFKSKGSLMIYRQLFILLARYGPARKIAPLFATFPRADLTVPRKPFVLGNDDPSAKTENEQDEQTPPRHFDELQKGIDNFELDDVPFPPFGSRGGKSNSRRAHRGFSKDRIALRAKEPNCGLQAWYRINDEATPPPDFREGFAFEEATPDSCSRLLGEDWVYDAVGLDDGSGYCDPTTMSLAPYRILASVVERNLYYTTRDARLDHLLLESARECCKRLEDWWAQAEATINERQKALHSEWVGDDSD